MISASQIPNILTICRILLIVPFALCIHGGDYFSALVLFFIAGLSDGVDGFLARQFNWRSRFGAIADPLADKLLLVTAYVMLAIASEIPQWLILLVIGRDLILVSGALLYHYFVSHYDISPSWLGKTCTFTQIIYVLALIMNLSGLPMLQEVIDHGEWVVGLITAVSGLHYCAIWGAKAMKEKGSGNA